MIRILSKVTPSIMFMVNNPLGDFFVNTLPCKNCRFTPQYGAVTCIHRDVLKERLMAQL